MLTTFDLPLVTDNVSTANPIPWNEWLRKQCDLRDAGNGIAYYGSSNHNYVIIDGYVLRNYGYNGRYTFNRLQTEDGKQWLFDEIMRFHRPRD